MMDKVCIQAVCWSSSKFQGLIMTYTIAIAYLTACRTVHMHIYTFSLHIACQIFPGIETIKKAIEVDSAYYDAAMLVTGSDQMKQDTQVIV